MYANACLTVDSTNISKVSRIPFFACERSRKKVRLIFGKYRMPGWSLERTWMRARVCVRTCVRVYTTTGHMH